MLFVAHITQLISALPSWWPSAGSTRWDSRAAHGATAMARAKVESVDPRSIGQDGDRAAGDSFHIRRWMETEKHPPVPHRTRRLDRTIGCPSTWWLGKSARSGDTNPSVHSTDHIPRTPRRTRLSLTLQSRYGYPAQMSSLFTDASARAFAGRSAEPVTATSASTVFRTIDHRDDRPDDGRGTGPTGVASLRVDARSCGTAEAANLSAPMPA